MNIHEINTEQIQTMRKNFKLLREEKNWTIKDLSEITGISEETLIGIENGEDFEIEFLFVLCRIYAISSSKIFQPRGGS